MLRYLLPATLLLLPTAAMPCTNFLVTRTAAADGSTMITYAADSHELYGDLGYIPAGLHRPGQTVDVIEWDTNRFIGRIPQVEQTFAVVGNMNEHQVSIGETTFTGREELADPKGGMDYGSLMFIALQRARTAREAVQIMGELVAAHGYCSTGEAFSIADPNEVWFTVMIGKGPGNKGAVWVAQRVPDGYVSAHANYARVGRFPLDDPKNCLYSPDVISFARDKGYFTGSDEEFHFADAYHPITWFDARVCEARVWSFFRSVAPSQNIPADFMSEDRKDVQLPLWIKPDRKLTVHDLFRAMRDHFEGTPYDLTHGVGAGPFHLPYRWRPLEWEIDGVKYFNERSTSTQQTGFSFIAQMRSSLPDPIGGVLWFGVDDASSTVYIPMYAGITEAPYNFRKGTGTFTQFSWDSAFWVFNFVSNWAYTRYCDIILDIRPVQWEFEGSFLARQADVEKAAVALYRQAPELAREYLTRYSAEQSAKVVERWRRLGVELFVKYMDGNVRDSQGKVTHPPLPEDWYRRIIKEDGEQFRVRKFPGEPEPKK
ncbi:MAG: dipeptidase [Deltaproteobacteria bacterium]|nr:dipeptidase [Deltaproteobacteria bacterium]